MGEVWGVPTRLSRETKFIRRSVLDGFVWAGTKLLYRRAWHAYDYNNGDVAHCPYCFDDVLKQTVDSRCPFCYGTGYQDGYGPVGITWGSVLENSPSDEKSETQGERIEQNMQLKLAAEPIFRNGDIFAEIRRMVGGKPTEIGRMFILDGPIRWQTVQGWIENVTVDRENRVEDLIVSQEGTVKLLLSGDIRYDLSDEFWGFKEKAQPYIKERESHPITPPEPMYNNSVDNWHNRAENPLRTGL